MDSKEKLFGMTKDEFEKSIDNYIQKLVARDNKRIKDIYTNGGSIFDRVIKHLLDKGAVDSEGILYYPEDYAFTVEEFDHLFETLVNYLEEEVGYSVDPEIMFENKQYYVKYKGHLVELFIMWGQGTATIMRLLEGESTNPPEKYIGEYSGFTKYVSNIYHKED